MPPANSPAVVLAVALGGACGSVARYLVSVAAVGWFPRFAPVGTLLVNLVGCLLIGLFTAAASHRGWPEPLRQLLISGFLGGLTTFSAFGFQTVELWREERQLAAFVNIFANVGSGLVLVACGLWLGRRLFAL